MPPKADLPLSVSADHYAPLLVKLNYVYFRGMGLIFEIVLGVRFSFENEEVPGLEAHHQNTLPGVPLEAAHLGVQVDVHQALPPRLPCTEHLKQPIITYRHQTLQALKLTQINPCVIHNLL